MGNPRRIGDGLHLDTEKLRSMLIDPLVVRLVTQRSPSSREAVCSHSDAAAAAGVQGFRLLLHVLEKKGDTGFL
ncbi:unnamed protein product [Pleuronectes platessa]|uniref:Uncharacterized protein n=1 Tax=Pleuronectes platessa TaxID=8262 RepID=A0A9N7VUM0_PLEPL|nr:unnamed protein product [Pleuronectes platessa]